ncbi:MAG: response regulator transcription factor, partial [Cyanobacteria bacterium]|nr:response regulator transcription factor [Cyanobacteriota bacterium]
RTIMQEILSEAEIVEVENGRDAVRLARTLIPDMILMDISMPELNGMKAAEEIWSSNQTARILFWSQYHREAYVRSLGRIVPDEAIHGYLLKGESDDKLKEAIASVFLNGDPYIDPVVQGVQTRLNSRCDSLSDTEFETLLDVAVGMTDRAIAARRHISVRGVQNRLSMLLSKLVKGEETHIRETVGMEVFNPRTRIIYVALLRGLINAEDLPELNEQAWLWIEDEFDYRRTSST